MDKYKVIGLMSGTSLDGLDIAYCSFSKNKKWSYAVKEATTIKYSREWLDKLKNAPHFTVQELFHLHNDYGAFVGNNVKSFIKKYKINKVDMVASHGHTIFHQPEKHFTFQLGHGAAIAAKCGLPVISDFRSLDIALGGQGAPLVPVGDELLFSEFDFCLNLGGFANISYKQGGKRIAFDICPVNIALNYMAGLLDMEYDKDGKVASGGKVNEELLIELNAVDYYKQRPPKSLGREWLEKEIIPLIENLRSPIEDKMATVVEHIACQIASTLDNKKGKMLVTGGGAWNKYLIQRIKKFSPNIQVIVPGKELVNYKEALVFAFLGVLRWRGEVNSLKSVTGASENNSGGSIFIK